MIERRETLINELITVRDYLRWGASRMMEAGCHFGHGTDNAWDEAVQLLMHSLHLPHALADERLLDAKLTLDERREVITIFHNRITERTPAAYITHEAWFADLPFYVDERVLVPRSPIAELIEKGFQPWLYQAPDRVLDLCCGSGCIGIAIAHYFDGVKVTLSDISTDALAVAEKNITRHQLHDRVCAKQSDLFANLSGERFDLIISNPPYVDAEDLAAMPNEFRREPSIALGSGDDGLDFTRRLLAQARDYLTPEGMLIVEVGNSWVALEQAFPQLPFTWVEFERGGHGVFVLHRDQLGH